MVPAIICQAGVTKNVTMRYIAFCGSRYPTIYPCSKELAFAGELSLLRQRINWLPTRSARTILNEKRIPLDTQERILSGKVFGSAREKNPTEGDIDCSPKQPFDQSSFLHDQTALRHFLLLSSCLMSSCFNCSMFVLKCSFSFFRSCMFLRREIQTRASCTRLLLGCCLRKFSSRRVACA